MWHGRPPVTARRPCAWTQFPLQIQTAGKTNPLPGGFFFTPRL